MTTSKRRNRSKDRRSLRRAMKKLLHAGRINTTRLLKSKYGAGAKQSDFKERDTKNDVDITS